MQIYKTINQVNGKWYIGKDAGDRAYYYGSGKALKNAILKYGKENFKKIILETCETKEQLIEREKHWISVTNAVTDKMSYNIAAGGEGGDLSKHIPYHTMNHKMFCNMNGAREWYNKLTVDEQKAWHKKQAEKRSKIWYVSRIETPHIEIEVKNLNQWCKDNKVEKLASSANKKLRHYGKAFKGWRCRKADDLDYPAYEDKRLIGHENIACKGKSWKLIDGKQVWRDK